YFSNYIDGSNVETNKPQTISGTGTFNAQVDAILNTPFNTGSVSQLRVNNTSPQGVTFLVPFNVVSGLVMTEGIIHTSATSVLSVGSPAMAYTASVYGNFGPTCYIDGPFAKDIGSGQNAIDLTNGSGFIDKFFFPVGKTAYAPIWVAVTTPSGGFNSPGTNIKVEAFETNSGTPSSNIAHLSQNRWEVSKTAGTVNDFNIKVADPTTIETSIIVQAPSAAGVYDNDFGITATFEAGTPNMLTSTSAPLDFADFDGYFSTARQSECSAVTPGNTLAPETNICGGKSVTLSLQNIIVGEGITYQWQSSINGTDYTDISMAVATTASVAPVENTYYRCNVTCSFSSTTVASTPIQITLNNTITSTTPATICQPIDTASLSATAASGDVKWYTTQVGGSALATGNSFITPSITTTTTYYAGTESTTAGTAGLVYTLDGYGTGSNNRGLAFNLSNAIILNSVKVYPQQNPGGSGPLPINIKVLQNGVQVPGTNEITFTPNTFSDWSPTTNAQTVTLNYLLNAGDNYSLEVTGGATYDNALAYVSPFPSPFPVANGAVTITGGIDNGFVDTYSYYYFFNWDITEVCSSARIAVTATVQTAEECGLSTPTSTLLSRVVAYPNPYTQSFKIDIQTNNMADVTVKVYDMIGRLLEQKTVSFNQLSNVEIGHSYPSGIYNVAVTQEGKLKTLQVIKN
nr:T9SS type A sorting domain-containing protein [Flavobacterium sp.]